MYGLTTQHDRLSRINQRVVHKATKARVNMRASERWWAAIAIFRRCALCRRRRHFARLHRLCVCRRKKYVREFQRAYGGSCARAFSPCPRVNKVADAAALASLFVGCVAACWQPDPEQRVVVKKRVPARRASFRLEERSFVFYSPRC